MFQPIHSSLSISHKDTVTPCVYKNTKTIILCVFYSHFNGKTLSALGPTGLEIFPSFLLSIFFSSYLLSHLSSSLSLYDRSVLEKLRHTLPRFWMISLLLLQAVWDNEISFSPEGHKRAPVCPSWIPILSEWRSRAPKHAAGCSCWAVFYSLSSQPQEMQKICGRA